MALSNQEMERAKKLLGTLMGSDFSGLSKPTGFAEAGADIMQTFSGAGKQIQQAFSGSKEILQNEGFTKPQKLMGVLGKVAGGASGIIGEAVIGAGKLALSQDSEQKIKDITQSVASGVASTDAAKAVIDWYGNLNEDDKLFVDSVGGVASFIADVYAPGLAKTATKPIVKGVGTATDAVKSGTQTAVKTVTDATGGASDIVKGLGTQVSDFGKRVASGAKETAEESRRLATLPEPEAKLIRTGVDDAAVKLIKESTQTEKNIYKELVEKAEVSTADLLAEQPKVIVGREFMKPVQHLLTVRDSVGAKLGAVRKSLSNAPMDITPQFREFQKYLDSRGVTVNAQGKFTGSGNIAPSDLRELQKMYDEIRPDKNGKVIRSQKWLDQWNQKTFKEYDLRQAREQTFSDDVVRVVEQARSSFKKALPEEYRKLSTQYAEIMQPLQEVVKLLGYKGDIEKLTAKEIKAAEVALRIIGGASDRPQSVIDSVLEAAQKTGYTSDVDLKKVVIFADALEDIYPNITPKRGLTGSVSRGVNQSGVGVAADVMTGNVKGILGQALTSSASQKEIQQALKDFLASLGE